MPTKTTAPDRTMPARRVAVLAKLAEQLVLLAETALRGHRGDIALLLMLEARAVLVSDIIGDPAIDVLGREAATHRAHEHVRRVTVQRLTEEQRYALTQLRSAEHDARISDLNQSRIAALNASRA